MGYVDGKKDYLSSLSLTLSINFKSLIKTTIDKTVVTLDSDNAITSTIPILTVESCQ